MLEILLTLEKHLKTNTMKRKFIIISSSVVVLALIVAMGIYAQSGSKSSNRMASEQTDKNVPDHCKKCPDASTCLDATNPSDTTASACKAKCAEMKSGCDKAKCDKCDKKESCSKSKDCVKKECPHKSAACCEKKGDAKECTKSADCKKDCEKKSN